MSHIVSKGDTRIEDAQVRECGRCSICNVDGNPKFVKSALFSPENADLGIILTVIEKFINACEPYILYGFLQRLLAFIRVGYLVI